MAQGKSSRVPDCQLFHEEIGHVNTVRCHDHGSKIAGLTEGQIIKMDLVLHFRVRDGDDMTRKRGFPK